MDKGHYLSFLGKYADNKHSEEEHVVFLEWFKNLSQQEANSVLEAYAKISPEKPNLKQFEQAFLIQKIENRLDALSYKEDINLALPNRSIWNSYTRIAASLLFLILAGVGIYFLNNSSKSEVSVKVEDKVNDIEPGTNRASLMLADGTIINLNDAIDGEIANQSGIQINKVSDGQLAYIPESENNLKEGLVKMNVLRTPKAGQYKLTLSDGTKVWLNSESSIHFPAAFSEVNRKVEISGEVYFEVAGSYYQGKRIPFQVFCNNQYVEVLGTHFNVNSYLDEQEIKTTLIEGSVKVFTLKTNRNTPTDSVKLKPGEQAMFKAMAGNVSNISVRKVDTEAAVAWKEGYFKFKDADIKEVMRQLARWYDLDVAFVGDLPRDQFTGYISKNVTISNILTILEEGGDVKFTITGKQVAVFNRR